MEGRLERRGQRLHPWHGPWRTIVPALFTLVVIVLISRLSYPLPGDSVWLLWLSRLDPVLSFSQLRWRVPAGSTLAGAVGAVIPAWVWLPLVVLLVSAAVGRVFCGWLCPVGGMLAVLQSGRDFLVRRRRPARSLSKGTPGSPVSKGTPGSPVGKGTPGGLVNKGAAGSTRDDKVEKSPVRAG